MKHKHSEVIKAWADGAQVEYLYTDTMEWHTTSNPQFSTNVQYRVKPEPKPDVVVFVPAGDPRLYRSKQRDGDNLRLTFDGETGKLKSAEVL